MNEELALYEYALILQPKYKDDDKIEDGQLLGHDFVLASSQQQAQIMAARAIPDEFVGDLDRVTVAMRPF